MAITFQKATKKKAKARLAFIGPSGSGKTWTALEIASLIGKKVAVIDTERGSASKYSDKFAFDVLELDSYSPNTYIEAIKAAEGSGYDVIVIDSLSHAWGGKDGILEQVDRKGGFTGGGWRDATPLHNRLVDSMIGAKAHVIVTMRSKTEYAIEANEKGKIAPRKIGLAPVQRDGMDYEFDVTAMLDHANNLVIDKTRCSELHGRTYCRQNKELVDVLLRWLSDGAEVTEAPIPKDSTTPTTSTGAITQTTMTSLQVALTAFLYEKGMTEEAKRTRRGRWISDTLGREVKSARDLSEADGLALLAEARQQRLPGQTVLPIAVAS